MVQGGWHGGHVLTGQLAAITLQDRLVGLIGAVEWVVVGSDRDETSTARACTTADMIAHGKLRAQSNTGCTDTGVREWMKPYRSSCSCRYLV